MRSPAVNTVFSRCYSVIIDPRVRFILATIGGLLVYYFLPHKIEFEIRLLLAWDVCVLFLLFVILIMMKNADAEQTLRRAQDQEPRNIVTLSFTVIICGASLVTVAFMLNDGQEWKTVPANVHLGLCTVAIFCAWFLLHAFFALHYARMYYDEIDEESEGDYKKGLEFPGGKLVDYWDFMYYSFTIAMCYQTSDVSVSSAPMRRLTLIHSILSFIFVALVIGLVVNVVSNLA
ncbi:MAG: DUF1345 domain-containing protein [Deltaproteobacteria bacterium]|uniref:DUF1345 domain-containing protein n=1 Tax=Candidatus Desulfacyla euxinica TaxID=2841693 RepID=A0A8J6N1R7_9DELT|nr:DUF1345 domain-containing protein [Candidatus Desulfacyla euxinica]MBL7216481.1 DUF1345 domain-containing protein [Desulfobacteraceae bacterium]